MAEADLCLMDEPLSNLDAKLRNEMRVEIRALQQRLGMSVIYVTHDQVEAMSMADKIVLMNDSKIEQIGLTRRTVQQTENQIRCTIHWQPADEYFRFWKLTLLAFALNILLFLTAGLKANVKGCDYHGADTIVLAELDENQEQSNLVKIRHPGHAIFTPGQNISIQWKPENEHRFS